MDPMIEALEKVLRAVHPLVLRGSYQRDGILALVRHWKTPSGFLLADAMGLGKTVQVAVAIRVALELQLPIFPIVVCAPLIALKSVWLTELRKWGVAEGTVVHHGGSRGKVHGRIVLTTHETFRRDHLGKYPWNLFISDEEPFKNQQTALYNEVSLVSTLRRVILSGTPLQNNLMELFASFHWLVPGLLGEEDAFRDTFYIPIQRPSRLPTSVTGAKGSAARKAQIERLKLAQSQVDAHVTMKALETLLTPHMLRRSNQVALPSKQEDTVYCDPTPEQQSAMAIVSTMFGDTLRRNNALRHITNGTTPTGPLGRLFHEKKVPTVRDVSKLIALRKIFLAWGEDQSILIYVHYKDTLRMLKKLYPTAGEISGDTPPHVREQVIDAFQSGHLRLLIATTQTAGVAVNLTRANLVVIFTVEYNPTHESQAAARCSRIGSQHGCVVLRLVTSGSFEDDMYSTGIVDKLLVAEGVLPSQNGHANAPLLGPSRRQIVLGGCTTVNHEQLVHYRRPPTRSVEDIVRVWKQQHKVVTLPRLRKVIGQWLQRKRPKVVTTDMLLPFLHTLTIPEGPAPRTLVRKALRQLVVLRRGVWVERKRKRGIG
jgi:SNF2 family DNA or RNA helicase